MRKFLRKFSESVNSYLLLGGKYTHANVKLI